ncbi:hypothetical protein QFZ71_002523 [Streptomyces sp. V2I9]|nr:hypothetical protein [Streptomyces sp. V2I9]
MRVWHPPLTTPRDPPLPRAGGAARRRAPAAAYPWPDGIRDRPGLRGGPLRGGRRRPRHRRVPPRRRPRRRCGGAPARRGVRPPGVGARLAPRRPGPVRPPRAGRAAGRAGRDPDRRRDRPVRGAAAPLAATARRAAAARAAQPARPVRLRRRPAGAVPGAAAPARHRTRGAPARSRRRPAAPAARRRRAPHAHPHPGAAGEGGGDRLPGGGRGADHQGAGADGPAHHRRGPARRPDAQPRDAGRLPDRGGAPVRERQGRPARRGLLRQPLPGRVERGPRLLHGRRLRTGPGGRRAAVHLPPGPGDDRDDPVGGRPARRGPQADQDLPAGVLDGVRATARRTAGRRRRTGHGGGGHRYGRGRAACSPFWPRGTSRSPTPPSGCSRGPRPPGCAGSRTWTAGPGAPRPPTGPAWAAPGAAHPADGTARSWRKADLSHFAVRLGP